ncbi:Nramp family divalent metal transporter [Burkholderia glumae]|uniref:Nramp family divalent metal transporter n=1 Tax=Burkholderia glumae TaxID=337 RepID=UPI000C270544|nr:Nramp family divalent metal transporter [Burkholderia glumae]MCM2552098.1 Nramp family divalent metal transporter [Burkholderia glumae]NVE24933.1 Nramp family divalent metal transporter [Burkholderia glumae]PJO21989.1 divalent metal cation transporter [Burkholderia glumae AU6208]QGA40988.1 Mn(2+) uptake NRAMP transporter MntH [Burkholderia glumae]QHE12833.1 Mn(2+) uptake NRAMP transporter MntH [Burkholderia glumae AU6208]
MPNPTMPTLPSPVRRLRPPTAWTRYAGAGALVAVGYMDPGNWATALAGGAQFGYRLLGVVALASLIAVLLQWVAARLGVVTGRDLAELCRARLSPRAALALWLATEAAIIACDVAEVVGCAVALQMLLHVPLLAGVLISAVGTFAMLALQRRGHRTLEACVAALILFVALCFVAEVALAQPDWAAALGGFAPSAELVRNAGMVWLAAGIVGATVMPHNLYLHSALVKRHAPPAGSARGGRRGHHGAAARRERDAEIAGTMRGVGFDTFFSLGFAFVVNAALLIVAAAVFHASGHTGVDDLADAHRLLAPLVGSHWASLLFAAALLACGLNATVTGTLAGQIVMEGFLELRISPTRRAILTRALAIGPALVAVAAFGNHGSAQLLVASQVVLSLQLPLAVIPLVRFAADPALMGRWRIRGWVHAAAWAATALILVLNLALLWQLWAD